MNVEQRNQLINHATFLIELVGLKFEDFFKSNSQVSVNDSQAAGVCPDANQRRVDRLAGLVQQEPKQSYPDIVSYERDQKEIVSLKEELAEYDVALKYANATLGRACNERDATTHEMKLTHEAMAKLKAAYAELQKQSEAHQNEKVELRTRCRVFEDRYNKIKALFD